MSTKAELKKRWQEASYSELAQKIFLAVENGTHIDHCIGIEYFDGKLDCRGLSFPEPMLGKFNDQFHQDKRAFRFKNYDFTNVDFSYSNFNSNWLININIEGCIFIETNLSNCNFENCAILKTTFKGANFSDTVLNSSNRKGNGHFNECIFEECNFTSVFLLYPTIEKCSFINSIYDSADFGGSRLKDCIFTGIMHNVWFRGITYGHEKKSFLSRLLFSHQKLSDRNRMANVDFTNAIFEEVFFDNYIDLSTCKFPYQKNYLKIKNIDLVYNKVKEIISSTWEVRYKQRAISIIDKILYEERKKNMDTDFIFTEWDFINVPSDFNTRFFGLIREVNKEINSD